jgi:hypothetical protein
VIDRSLLVWLGLTALVLFLFFRTRTADGLARRANILLQQGCVDRSSRSVAILKQACGDCEKVIAKNPRHEFGLQVWGTALWWLGKRASGAEADRYYQAAEEKFASALALKGDDVTLATDRFWALRERAELHPGANGAPFLRVICEECERILRSRRKDRALLAWWASALSSLSVRTTPEEASQLLAQAEAKLKAALALYAEDASVMASLSNVLWRRAKLSPGGEGEGLLREAGEWAGKSRQLLPLDAVPILTQACVLFSRTKVLPGEETTRQVDEAARAIDAIPTGDDPDPLLLARGIIRWSQAYCATGEAAARLLGEAKQRLTESAARRVSSAEYNLACICARLGEEEECRQWLEKSREPGILVSREQMAEELELESVRAHDWFHQMLRDS